jgi:hypothetical protein
MSDKTVKGTQGANPTAEAGKAKAWPTLVDVQLITGGQTSAGSLMLIPKRAGPPPRQIINSPVPPDAGYATLRADGSLQVRRPGEKDTPEAAPPAEKAEFQAALRDYIRREGNPTLTWLRGWGVKVDSNKPLAAQPAVLKHAEEHLRHLAEEKGGWSTAPPSRADVDKWVANLQQNSDLADAALRAFLR